MSAAAADLECFLGGDNRDAKITTALDEIHDTANTLRGRVDLRAVGLIKLFVDIMARGCEAKSPIDRKVLHATLRILELCVRDRDNALELVRCAGHSRLLTLLAYGEQLSGAGTDADEEDVDKTIDLASAVVETCREFTPFPSKPTALLETSWQHLPQVQRFKSLCDVCCKTQTDQTDPATCSCGSTPTCVAISTVQNRMESQLTTGYKLWGGAVVLARWIHQVRRFYVLTTV